MNVDGRQILVDFECERNLDGWKPRRFGNLFLLFTNVTWYQKLCLSCSQRISALKKYLKCCINRWGLRRQKRVRAVEIWWN